MEAHGRLAGRQPLDLDVAPADAPDAEAEHLRDGLLGGPAAGHRLGPAADVALLVRGEDALRESVAEPVERRGDPVDLDDVDAELGRARRDEARRQGRIDPFVGGGHRPIVRYSTVTDLARLRGWSTSVPRATAMWYAKSWSGMTARIGLERLVGVGHPADIVGEALDLRVALGRDGDDPGVAGPAFHHVADDLVVDRRAGGHGHERALRVEQADGAVLELAGRVALGVDVADFLELERALQGGRVRVAPADEHEAPRVHVAAGEDGRPVGVVEGLLGRVREGPEGAAELHLGVLAATCPGPWRSRPRG